MKLLINTKFHMFEKTKYLFIWISLFVTFTPEILMYISNASFIFRTIVYTRVIILIILLFACVLKGRISKYFCSVFIFCFIVWVSTSLNGGEVKTLSFNTLTIMTICLLIEVMIKENTFIFLKSTFSYFFVMSCINLFLLIEYPEGVIQVPLQLEYTVQTSYFPMNFLQSDNRLIMFLLPLLLITMLCFQKKVFGKLTVALVIIVVAWTLVQVWVVNSILGFISFFTTYMLLRIFKEKVKIKISNLIIIIILCLQLLTFLILQSNYFLSFTTAIFDKNASLLARMDLMNQAFELIREHPLLGYGSANGAKLMFVDKMFYWVHNHSIDIIIQGGIVLLCSFYTMIKTSLSNFNRTKQMCGRESIISALVSVFAMGCFERFTLLPDFFFILTIVAFSDLDLEKTVYKKHKVVA